MAILKACRNRNIVGFLGEYVDNERTWLIMEYMEVPSRHATSNPLPVHAAHSTLFLLNVWLCGQKLSLTFRACAGRRSVQGSEERQGWLFALEQEVSTQGDPGHTRSCSSPMLVYRRETARLQQSPIRVRAGLEDRELAGRSRSISPAG